MSGFELEIDEDWEEWNPSKGSFVVHTVAGSLAGLMEHTAMFPIDTIKTHLQAKNGQQHLRRLFHEEGFLRMWRGSSAVMTACIPSHAAYFSVYELAKEKSGANRPGHHPIAAGVSGALATIMHDTFMAPMDLCKQRLQLGLYNGFWDCLRSIVREEGFKSLFISYPTTVLMNIPYAATLVATNESLKTMLNPSEEHNMTAFLVSGAGAGAMAAAVTNPLDVAKTRLQTQELCLDVHCSGPQQVAASKAATGATGTAGNIRMATAAMHNSNRGTHTTTMRPSASIHKYKGIFDAIKKIKAEEGMKGFARGMKPRLLFHAPSAAISWTTYETVKHLLIGWDL